MLFKKRHLVDEDHENNPDTKRDAILAIGKSFFVEDLFQTIIFKIKVKFPDSVRKFVVDDGGTGGPNVNENAISNGNLTLKSYVKDS